MRSHQLSEVEPAYQAVDIRAATGINATLSKHLTALRRWPSNAGLSAARQTPATAARPRRARERRAARPRRAR